MTYAIGDPDHIEVHESIRLLFMAAGLDPDLIPGTATIGATGHVDDHNRIADALEWLDANGVLGAWADVSATTGSPTATTPTGYHVYEFASSGSFTIPADGWVEYLVQAGGGGSTGNYGGGGGNTRYGVAWLTAGTYTVTVGAAGAATPTDGGTSEIVGVAKCLGGVRGGTTAWGQGAKGGTGDLFGGGGGSLTDGSGGTGGAGITSSITGTSLEYGKGGNYPGPAAGVRGGGASGAAAGGPGVVIIRTKD
jgi:hypothetical protein